MKILLISPTSVLKPLVRCTACILLLLICHFSNGQIEVVSIPHGKGIIPSTKSTHSNSRIQSTPIALPFWDDFSSGTGYVNPSLWEDSKNVHISRGAGINAPSMNVVVFNGLDSLGAPYNLFDLTGYTDSLKSAPIDLSTVTMAGRDSVFLNFFLQMAGRGELPEGNDFLQVDFKNSNNEWVLMQEFSVADFQDNTEVLKVSIPVTGASFFHNQFQFRFRSSGLQSGDFDTWVLDYVYLNDTRMANWFSFPDRAVAAPLGPLYARKYYAMPYLHFVIDKPFDTLQYEVQNNRGGDGGVTDFLVASTFRVNALFVNHKNGITTSDFQNIDDFESYDPDNPAAINALERIQVNYGGMKGLGNNILDDADSASVSVEVILNSDDANDLSRDPFLPLDFRKNDTTRVTYPITNYYAYDDGQADHGIRLTQPGNRLAYRFEMPIDTATILGFWVYFPHTNGPSSETIEFQVYEDEGGLPKTLPLRTASITINKTRNNNFVYVDLSLGDIVFVGGGVFYIGYKQPQTDDLVLGLDGNNDTWDQLFVFANGTWNQNVIIHGSLMLRPVIGEGGATNPITDIERQDEKTWLYPNPTDGNFYIQGSVNNLSVTDITGRPIQFVTKKEESGMQVSLNSPAAGLYLVRWSHQREYLLRKVIVR